MYFVEGFALDKIRKSFLSVLKGQGLGAVRQQHPNVQKSISEKFMPVSYQFKSMNDLVDYLNQLERRINDLEVENSDLRTKITSIDNRSLDVIAFVKDHWPKTGLASPSFWMRAITVYGHYFVIQLIIGILMFFIYLLVLAPIISSALSSILPTLPQR